MAHNWTEDDIAAIELKGTVDVEWQTPTGEKPDTRLNDAWTQTEIDFAHEYLEPRLQSGEFVAWWPQPKFRLPFMTYTPDFAAITTVGRLQFYEVKGKYRLGSAGRSSLAVRVFNHFVKSVAICRMTRTDDGWKIEEIVNKRELGPHTRAEVNDETND